MNGEEEEIESITNKEMIGQKRGESQNNWPRDYTAAAAVVATPATAATKGFLGKVAAFSLFPPTTRKE